jgi:hypothetical protein
MTTNKQSFDQKRSLRLLSMLAKQPASLEPSANEQTCFLHFKGLRRVKCDRKMIGTWIASELIAVRGSGDAQEIFITALGQKHIIRNREGDFAAQHKEIQTDQIKLGDCLQTVRRNISESPLSALYRAYSTGKKSWLSSGEFDAGERLRMDFEYAQMGPKITASWDPTSHLNGGKGGRRPAANHSERTMGARARIQRAIEAVGPELSGVLLDVCCFLKGMEDVERERQWPRRSAKLMLKVALSMLERHYHPPASGAASSKIRHWGHADFRPEM